MYEGPLHRRHAVGGKFHDKRSDLPPEQGPFKDLTHQDGHRNANKIDRKDDVSSLIPEKGSSDEYINGQPRATTD